MSFNQFINKYELHIDFMQYFSARTAVLNYIRRKQIHIGPYWSHSINKYQHAIQFQNCAKGQKGL